MKRRILKIILITLLSLIPISAFYAYTETYLFEEKNIEIKNKEIPIDFNNFKILFISDIHYNKLFFKDQLTKLINKVNATEKDAIIIGGDYVNGKTDEEILYALEELKKLEKPKYGIYSVLGNHDNQINQNIIFNKLEEVGIKNINNNSFWLCRDKAVPCPSSKNDQKIKIGGVGELVTDFQMLENTTNDTKKEDFVILAAHNPDYVETIKDQTNIDLILSGHTHAGQITLFGWKGLINPSIYGEKYRQGLKDLGYTKIYITRGVGETGLPLRFFARPEITVINLHN